MNWLSQAGNAIDAEDMRDEAAFNWILILLLSSWIIRAILGDKNMLHHSHHAASAPLTRGRGLPRWQFGRRTLLRSLSLLVSSIISMYSLSVMYSCHSWFEHDPPHGQKTDEKWKHHKKLRGRAEAKGAMKLVIRLAKRWATLRKISAYLTLPDLARLS